MSESFSNDAELIDALISFKGKGEQLLNEWGSIARLAQNLDVADLTQVQHRKLSAAFALHFLREKRTSISSPADIFSICSDLQAEDQEHLVILVFDTRNNLLQRVNLYKGSANSSQVRVAEVLRPAIVHKGTAIVMVHNHPSGDPTPSPDDVNITRIVYKSAREMDIELLDHVVIGAGRFVSMKERGLGFS